MKKLLFTCLTLLSLSTAHGQCKQIIGYFPSWQWYDRNKLVNPQTIDYSKYTIINYSFFNPQADGVITAYDSWADDNLLVGSNSLIEEAHAESVNILASVGGWTLSGNFPTIAASAGTRTAFAHACTDLCRQYSFDGIDIDWEYPGFVDHNGTPADMHNYTLMMQELRDSLTAYGTSINSYKILTACFGASRSNMQNIEWNDVKNIVDYINVMSYDYFGSWDAVANHNSPLFAPDQGDTTMNVAASVSYLINHYNVPSTKITSGVAFYGRSAKTTTAPALFAPIVPDLVDTITFHDDLGMPLYYNILQKMNLFTDHWDNEAKVPYATGNGSLSTFLSYDNKASIAMKAQYAVDMNLAGAIIWEMTGDYIETSPGSGIVAGTPLVDTLKSVMCANIPTPTAVANKLNTVSKEILAYPNPASGKLNLQWELMDVRSLQIISMTGTVVLELEKLDNKNELSIDVSQYAAGIYTADALTKDGKHLRKLISVIK
jgi:chitinase